MAEPRIRILDSIAQAPAAQWNALAGDNPFLQHAFLLALEETGCVSTHTGWTPCHVTYWERDALSGAMPLYLKTHSYGEYVFDWSWADAYERHGLRYYPKLLCAIPFTPATGPRLLGATSGIRRALLDGAFDLAGRRRVSSLHVLLPPAAQATELEARGMMIRSSVQFHWENPGLRDFDEFLARMNAEKRKKIKQERRRVHDAGITFERLSGREASEADWDFFTRCYNRTYRLHHSTPYLNRAFFGRLAEVMPDNLLLVIARRDGRRVASALNMMGGGVLYGRYWGATEFHSGLHFEACYYQGLEFCIEHALRAFEGGAQGEHKLARGLLPVRTLSAHWLAHPQFARAIEHYLERETQGIGEYLNELDEHSPFKQQK
ncbi:MAG TPA: GNAT family N-acetyltransferase [Burkholderiales bacterium]|nr:GNAT family N-acetyltransferase [Burkholderiales bacterium]